MEIALELPVLEPAGVERVDAARNRERVLCAAQRLFAERGVACVSMDEVAEAAGVGKGTLFRRFGSRAELARAVLSERERAFQEEIIRGCPPLGPGAPAAERLVAFGNAVIDMLDGHVELLLAAEDGGARFSSAPYAIYRLHLTLLLAQADPHCDGELLAEILLAYLRADLFGYLRDVRGFSLDRIKTGWEELVRRAVPAATASLG